MTKNEITIWAAGFFDGEGCVSIGKPGGKSTSHRLVVKVCQKKQEPLVILQRHWGGSLWLDERYGVWQWQVCAQIAKQFLSEIEPYLVVKHKQARIAISFQSRRNPLENRTRRLLPSEKKRDESDYTKMKALNMRGAVS